MIELIQTYPHWSIIILAFIVSFFISLVNYFVMDKDKMRALKERQKAIQQEMKHHKDNHAKMMELNQELMGQMGETFKHSFKPMLITFIPIIIFFSIMKGWYTETTLAKTWIWWYIGASIVGSIIFRKLLKLP